MSITTSSYGLDVMGRAMTLYTMTNHQGASLSVLDYGAHIVSIRMPDKFGVMGEVSLGFDTLAPYERAHACMGATIGRYANRIGGARFMLGDKTYSLFQNENGNCLHGGRENFQFKHFTARILQGDTEDAVVLTYLSSDGQEGFPGALKVQVTMSLSDDNTVALRYMAQSNKDTVVNLTNHAYFNLCGEGNILSHRLMIDADYITQTNDELIPTGVLLPVDNTPFDMRGGRLIGEGIGQMESCHTLKNANGYDVNFCLNGDGMRPVAMLSDEKSGRRLRVVTDQPGLQLYSGQGLDFVGHQGRHYGAYSGVALETQHYADSPNHANFPSTLIKAGEVFMSATLYEFGTC